MKEFDYIIIGGGCAGLSLAYELEVYDKLKDKTLAIIEPRTDYKRDKTWSFWKVFSHNFEDCIKKSWNSFTINTPNETKYIDCESTPYQTIDSGKFYEKILSKLKLNKNKLPNELIVMTDLFIQSESYFWTSKFWRHCIINHYKYMSELQSSDDPLHSILRSDYSGFTFLDEFIPMILCSNQLSR